MKKTISLVILWVLASVQLVKADDVVISAVEIVGYGVFTAANQAHSRGFTSSSVAADSVEGVRFTDFTSKIQAELGTNFGFGYMINTRPKRPMKVTSVIKFPEPGLVRPNGKIYKESRETSTVKVGEPTYYGYGFDEEWEMVPGEWTFEIWHKNARLVKKSFTVLPPVSESD